MSYAKRSLVCFLLLSWNITQAQVTYVHTDHLGSVVAESNSAGSITRRFHYKPFGESIEVQQDDVGYTGHKHDADLGLTYMQARYYDPVLGRFVAVDPISFTGDEIEHFNQYMYANNNPISNIDPDGRDTMTFNPVDVDIVLGGGGGLTLGFFYDDGNSGVGKGKDVGLVFSFRAGVGADVSVGSTAGKFLGSASEMVGIADFVEGGIYAAEGQLAILPDGSTGGTEIGLSMSPLPASLTTGKELTGKMGLRDIADGAKFVGEKVSEAASWAAELVSSGLIIHPKHDEH